MGWYPILFHSCVCYAIWKVMLKSNVTDQRLKIQIFYVRPWNISTGNNRSYDKTFISSINSDFSFKMHTHGSYKVNTAKSLIHGPELIDLRTKWSTMVHEPKWKTSDQTNGQWVSCRQNVKSLFSIELIIFIVLEKLNDLGLSLNKRKFSYFLKFWFDHEKTD